ncbi:MAG: aminotransferase class V-fold PLP-dependent enzyme [Candidatus Hydrothermarchaeales archaeon]
MRIKVVRGLFPIVKRVLYFDAASLSPYCIPVMEALKTFGEERRDFASLYYDKWYSEIEKCRVLAAGLLNASTDEIAFTKSTSEGVNLTAQLVDWKRGDEVVVCDCDFPTNIYPFLNLESKGVKVKYVKTTEGKVPTEEIEQVLGDSTKLLSISHVFYSSGYRIQLEKLGKLCKENGVLLHVDAAQSLGAFQINVRKAQIDFLSAPGYKWLLSPLGTGLVYVKKEHIDKTPVLGWLSVKDPERLDAKGFELLDSAKRFEAGNLNIGGFLGMHAALKLIDSIGMKSIERRVLELSLSLAEELERAGLKVTSEIEKQHRSGIVSIKNRRFTKDFLRKHNIVATIRKNLRLSPHIYNTQEEIEKAVGTLSGG